MKGRKVAPEVRRKISERMKEYYRLNPMEPGKPRPGAQVPRPWARGRRASTKPNAAKLPNVVLRAIAAWEKTDRSETLNDYLARKAERSKVIADYRFGKTYVVFAHIDPRDGSAFHIGWKPAEANLKAVDYTGVASKMKRLQILSEFYDEPVVRIIAEKLSWAEAQDIWREERRKLKGERG